MPDGDIVHPGVSPRFQQLYVQVCEGELAEDDLVRKALACLIKEVEFFGEDPLHRLRRKRRFLRIYSSDASKEKRSTGRTSGESSNNFNNPLAETYVRLAWW